MTHQIRRRARAGGEGCVVSLRMPQDNLPHRTHRVIASDLARLAENVLERQVDDAAVARDGWSAGSQKP